MDPISSFSTLWKQVYEADKINVEKSDDGSRCMKVQDNSHYKNIISTLNLEIINFQSILRSKYRYGITNQHLKAENHHNSKARVLH